MSDNDKIRDRLRTHLVNVIIDAEALYPGIIDEVRRDLIAEQTRKRLTPMFLREKPKP